MTERNALSIKWVHKKADGRNDIKMAIYEMIHILECGQRYERGNDPKY